MKLNIVNIKPILTDLIEDVLEALLCEGGALDVLDGPQLLGQPLAHLEAQRLLLVLCCKETMSITHPKPHRDPHVTQAITRYPDRAQLVLHSFTDTHT